MSDPATNAPFTAVTIGHFDGVHMGHAALVRACRQAAGARGRVIAMAFDPHPATTLAPERAPARLTTFEHRTQLLKALGADEVVRLEPTRDLLSLTPEEFVDRVLMPLAPSVVVEGDDFHFGRERAGNTRVLARLGASRGFRVHVEPPKHAVLDDLTVVRASSSLVRWLIGHGRVRDAGSLLGRAYAVSGEIVRGDQRGREIGYPTANLRTPLLLPADGVYAGTMVAPSGQFYAAISVGRRPTFGGLERRIEVFAMDRTGRAAVLPMEYGWTAHVAFEHWVREDLRFGSAGQLVGQIGRDVGRSLDLLFPRRDSGFLTIAAYAGEQALPAAEHHA